MPLHQPYTNPYQKTTCPAKLESEGEGRGFGTIQPESVTPRNMGNATRRPSGLPQCDGDGLPTPMASGQRFTPPRENLAVRTPRERVAPKSPPFWPYAKHSHQGRVAIGRLSWRKVVRRTGSLVDRKRGYTYLLIKSNFRGSPVQDMSRSSSTSTLLGLLKSNLFHRITEKKM